ETLGRRLPTRPITLNITGIKSESTVSVTKITSFHLRFGSCAVLRVSSVVVPGWKGEILLGWKNLQALGLNFTLDKRGIPTRERFARWNQALKKRLMKRRR